MHLPAMRGLILATFVVGISVAAATHVRHVVPASLLQGGDNGVCAVPSSQRLECGFRGIERWECLRANCCWGPDHPRDSEPRDVGMQQQTQCFHRVAVATLEDRTRVVEQVAVSEAHVWRVYNPKGLSPARFVVEFPPESDIDMLVKCCDSSGGASPTCPDFDNFDYWSRELPRRSPFRYDVYDSDAARCGEWGVMIHGVGRGNNSYTIYSEVDRDVSTVTDLAAYQVHSGSMIRDDWRFYRFHVRRAYNVHIPLQVNKFADLVTRTLRGSTQTHSLKQRWNVSLPIDVRSVRGFRSAKITYTGHACPNSGSGQYAFGSVSFGSRAVVSARYQYSGSCGAFTHTVDIAGIMGALVAEADPTTGALNFEAVGSLTGRDDSRNRAAWTLDLVYNAETALYTQWDHLPHWMANTHATETRVFAKPNTMCVQLEFDVPRTGILYVGFNTTSEAADYSIQILQNNRGACEIQK